MPTTVTKVLSVNDGRAREFDYNGRPAKSAIWKLPTAGRIAARGVNLEGDDQADRKAHGGPDKSVYAYSIEDVRWWEETLGRSLQYGEFGYAGSQQRFRLDARSRTRLRPAGIWNYFSRRRKEWQLNDLMTRLSSAPAREESHSRWF